MNDGWKEFHLVAEPVVREIAPGMKANLWGYNGQSPGPTIECVEGDRLRIFVTNKLPEHTTIHWHGVLLPNGMDGVGGLNQPQIPVGQDLRLRVHDEEVGHLHVPPARRRDGADGDGHDGLHRRAPERPGVHARRPRLRLPASTRTTSSRAPTRRRSARCSTSTSGRWNSRVFPGIDHLVVRKDDRVRIRIGNLTMTNHPIHMHGHDFEVTGTDGGWVPKAARWPEVTVDMAVGADARDRVRRRRARRLGVPLPQVAPHDERDGPRRADHDRRRSSRRRGEDPRTSCPTTW